MPAPAKFSTVVIDCAEPTALADFYRKVTGWEITYSDPDFATIGDGGPAQISFQRVTGYHPPAWPSGPAHTHLDLTVADIGGATKELLELGAAKPEFQPGEGKWVVLTDPEGHPFCIAAGE